MLKWLAKLLSSLMMRIFLAFWLIALISAFSTHWISQQLASDQLVQRAHPMEKNKVRHLARRINHSDSGGGPSAERLLSNDSEFPGPPMREIWLKDLATGAVQTNSKFANDDIRQSVQNSGSRIGIGYIVYLKNSV